MKEIIFTKHSKDRMIKRGVKKEEILKTLKEGDCRDAKFGRFESLRDFNYNSKWKGKFYKKKQVVVIFKEEDENIVIITVYAFYYEEVKI